VSPPSSAACPAAHPTAAKESSTAPGRGARCQAVIHGEDRTGKAFAEETGHVVCRIEITVDPSAAMQQDEQRIGLFFSGQVEARRDPTGRTRDLQVTDGIHPFEEPPTVFSIRKVLRKLRRTWRGSFDRGISPPALLGLAHQCSLFIQTAPGRAENARLD